MGTLKPGSSLHRTSTTTHITTFNKNIRKWDPVLHVTYNTDKARCREHT